MLPRFACVLVINSRVLFKADFTVKELDVPRVRSLAVLPGTVRLALPMFGTSSSKVTFFQVTAMT